MNITKLTENLDTNAMMELTSKGSKYFMANMNPMISQEKKSEMLNELLESLSDDTFFKLAPTLVANITFEKERAKTFADSDAQVDAYIKKRPKMTPYREDIKKRMAEFRKKCKLPC
jgi:hypothetical protein